ncbi:hypothetical protein [Desulfurispora thermophila]|uniref:hypothetical protein n=1 Tax=Desulfurispora thermophila TaxID=265470 RepID=UPI0003693D1B|nr:hypothetical protein [Desulfurispora thermophila]
MSASQTKTNAFDFNALLKPLQDICAQCDLQETGQCQKSACLIGYARKVLEFARSKNCYNIPGGEQLIPKNDFKPYYHDTIAPALAETCRQCKECRDNHNSDCVIALVRHTLEHCVLPESVDYPGSVFMYLAKIKELNPDLAASLAAAYKK